MQMRWVRQVASNNSLCLIAELEIVAAGGGWWCIHLNQGNPVYEHRNHLLQNPCPWSRILPKQERQYYCWMMITMMKRRYLNQMALSVRVDGNNKESKRGEGGPPQLDS